MDKIIFSIFKISSIFAGEVFIYSNGLSYLGAYLRRIIKKQN